MDDYILEAPVEIGGNAKTAFMLVRRDAHTQRLYVHAVVENDKLQAPSRPGQGPHSGAPGAIRNVARHIFGVNEGGNIRFSSGDHPRAARQIMNFINRNWRKGGGMHRNKEKPVSGWREARGLIPLNISVHCPGNQNFPQITIWVKGDSPWATNHDRLSPWRWADSSAAQLLPDPLQAEGKNTLHQGIGL